MIFHSKICILGEYLYVSHTLEGNHNLFGEKLYFIWKFSSGNTGLVVSMSASHAVGHGSRHGLITPKTIIKMLQTAFLLGTQALE